MFRQSILNQGEVNVIIQLVGDLMLNNLHLDPGDIGIISPYVAQTRLLQDTFQTDAIDTLEPVLGRHRAEQVTRVEINTVDGFQGREKDIIILSTVRSNSSGHIGFLTDQRRLNVALTRAKDALLVVGNKRTLKMATLSEWKVADQDADGGIWRRYIGWLEQRGLVHDWEENRS
jgi:superfamily I DNA and/or RNA helicase